MPNRARLTVTVVGPTAPPYGGMATYSSLLVSSLRDRVDAVRFVALPGARRGGLPGRCERLAHFCRAARCLASGQADVVHCISGSYPNLLANAAMMSVARLWGHKTVLSLVGADVPHAVASGRSLRRLLVGLALRSASAIIACNVHVRRAVSELGYPALRLVLVSNALPPVSEGFRIDGDGYGSLQSFAKSHAPLVGSVSGWHHFYGSDTLVEAFERLRKGYSEAGLVIVFKGGGDGSYRRDFYKRVHESRYTTDILVLEAVPHIAPVLSALDIFVRTALSEGDSMAVREALAAGLPVVATSTGYRPEGVWLYTPGDAVALTATLQSLVSTPTTQSNTGDDATVAGAQNLSRIVTVYEIILAGRRERTDRLRQATSVGEDARSD